MLFFSKFKIQNVFSILFCILPLALVSGPFLSDLICKEEKWLNKQEHKKKFIIQLEKLGWNISFEEWTEFVYQKVDNTIIKRWLNQGSEYREIILKNCEEETLIRLQELFKRLDGQTIKQKLIHTKFLAKNSN